MKIKHIGITIATFILMFSLVGCGILHDINDNTASATESKIQNYSSNDGIYEFVDPDTGVHYLVYCHGLGNSGMGGITPRLNADGSVMVDKEETTESK
jgi:lipoprotein